jgi:predicted nucleotidyltransferase component of viral defense system
VSDQITTDDLLDDAEARTGLLRSQLLMMVAKSAAVRHVATKAEDGDLFVLKGGTLLTHVYKSPRQSVADADYLHLDTDEVIAPKLEEALRFTEGGFTMDPYLSFDAGRESFAGKGVFSFDDIRITKRRDRELKITVSVRPGERLDPPTRDLYYSDSTLTGTTTFLIEGLTVNELCAEKLLGWSSKDLPKHLVDLAYVARELEGEVSHDRVASLVRDKFAIEGRADRYHRQRITKPSDLVPRFTDPERIGTLLHNDWSRLSQDEVFFLPAESTRPDDEVLLDSRNVERLALEFWEPTLAQL